MSSTVGSLIHAFYDTPSLTLNPQPSVSRKAWADGYRMLHPRHVTFHEGTMGSIDNFLGPVELHSRVSGLKDGTLKSDEGLWSLSSNSAAV